MSQAFSGAAIAAVIALLWLLGRRRSPLLRDTDASAIALLNRVQIERSLAASRNDQSPADGTLAGASASGAATSAGPTPGEGPAAGSGPIVWPRDARGRGLLLRQLNADFQAGGARRRQALERCAAWQHRDCLPLIRRGLRDADPAVAVVAAAAISRFRGRSPAPAAQAAPRRPRNVSRTR